MRVRERLVSGEVEVGEQGQIATQEPPLLLDRFFHLQQKFRLAPRRRGVGNDLGTNGAVRVVFKAAADASTGFDEYLMARRGQRFRAGRDERHPIFIGLDLFGYTDAHSRDIR